jgi:hypothetical protein
MLRFKVLSKVHSFHFRGKRYFPGEIVECSEEDAALFNMDFLERVLEPKLEVEPESAMNAEVSVSDVASTLVELGPKYTVENIVVHPASEKKIKPKVLPKDLK